jgi:hypothetical protein
MLIPLDTSHLLYPTKEQHLANNEAFYTSLYEHYGAIHTYNTVPTSAISTFSQYSSYLVQPHVALLDKKDCTTIPPLLQETNFSDINPRLSGVNISHNTVNFDSNNINNSSQPCSDNMNIKNNLTHEESIVLQSQSITTLPSSYFPQDQRIASVDINMELGEDHDDFGLFNHNNSIVNSYTSSMDDIDMESTPTVPKFNQNIEQMNINTSTNNIDLFHNNDNQFDIATFRFTTANDNSIIDLDQNDHITNSTTQNWTMNDDFEPSFHSHTSTSTTLSTPNQLQQRNTKSPISFATSAQPIFSISEPNATQSMLDNSTFISNTHLSSYSHLDLSGLDPLNIQSNNSQQLNPNSTSSTTNSSQDQNNQGFSEQSNQEQPLLSDFISELNNSDFSVDNFQVDYPAEIEKLQFPTHLSTTNSPSTQFHSKTQFSSSILNSMNDYQSNFFQSHTSPIYDNLEEVVPFIDEDIDVQLVIPNQQSNFINQYMNTNDTATSLQRFDSDFSSLPLHSSQQDQSSQEELHSQFPTTSNQLQIDDDSDDDLSFLTQDQSIKLHVQKRREMLLVHNNIKILQKRETGAHSINFHDFNYNDLSTTNPMEQFFEFLMEKQAEQRHLNHLDQFQRLEEEKRQKMEHQLELEALNNIPFEPSSFSSILSRSLELQVDAYLESERVRLEANPDPPPPTTEALAEYNAQIELAHQRKYLQDLNQEMVQYKNGLKQLYYEQLPKFNTFYDPVTHCKLTLPPNPVNLFAHDSPFIATIQQHQSKYLNLHHNPVLSTINNAFDNNTLLVNPNWICFGVDNTESTSNSSQPNQIKPLSFNNIKTHSFLTRIPQSDKPLQDMNFTLPLIHPSIFVKNAHHLRINTWLTAPIHNFKDKSTYLALQSYKHIAIINKNNFRFKFPDHIFVADTGQFLLPQSRIEMKRHFDCNMNRHGFKYAPVEYIPPQQQSIPHHEPQPQNQPPQTFFNEFNQTLFQIKPQLLPEGMRLDIAKASADDRKQFEEYKARVIKYYTNLGDQKLFERFTSDSYWQNMNKVPYKSEHQFPVQYFLHCMDRHQALSYSKSLANSQISSIHSHPLDDLSIMPPQFYFPSQDNNIMRITQSWVFGQKLIDLTTIKLIGALNRKYIS